MHVLLLLCRGMESHINWKKTLIDIWTLIYILLNDLTTKTLMQYRLYISILVGIIKRSNTDFSILAIKLKYGVGWACRKINFKVWNELCRPVGAKWNRNQPWIDNCFSSVAHVSPAVYEIDSLQTVSWRLTARLWIMQVWLKLGLYMTARCKPGSVGWLVRNVWWTALTCRQAEQGVTSTHDVEAVAMATHAQFQ